MSVRTDKLPLWTMAAPLVAIGIYLALHTSTSVLAGAALAAALLAGVMAAVYHAEVVAARSSWRSP
jgi:Ca2+:H+ antiporter